MSDPKRMHIVAAVAGLFAALKEFMIPIVLLYFFGRDDGNGMNWFFAFAIAVPFIFSIGRWIRFTYHMVDTTLIINEGLFVRKRVNIPKNRVQSIDITAGPLQRLFSLVSVRIQTAGNKEAAVDLSAITKSDANQIVEILRGSSVDGISIDSEANVSDIDSTPSAPADIAYSLPFNRLIAAGLTSGQIGVILSIVFTIASQLDDVIDFDRMIATIEMWLPMLANSAIMLTVFAILATWVFSILGTMITYYGFSLTKSERELVVRYGLLSTKQVSIPYNRVQAVRFSEGLLRQPFGYGSLYVESAGQGDEKLQSSCIIAPYIHKDEVQGVIAHLLPDLSLTRFDWQYLPERSKLRYILRVLRPVVVIAAVIAWFVPYGWAIASVVLLISVQLGLSQFKTARFAFSGDRLKLKTRFLAKTTVTIKRSRIQSAEYVTNLFMHRRDLWSFNVVLASVSKNLNYGISYLGAEQKPMFESWFQTGIGPRNNREEPFPILDDHSDIDSLISEDQDAPFLVDEDFLMRDDLSDNEPHPGDSEVSSKN